MRKKIFLILSLKLLVFKKPCVQKRTGFPITLAKKAPNHVPDDTEYLYPWNHEGSEPVIRGASL